MQHKVTIVVYDGAYQAALRPPGKVHPCSALTPSHSDEKQIHTFPGAFMEALMDLLWGSLHHFRCFIEPSQVISAILSPAVSFVPRPHFTHGNQRRKRNLTFFPLTLFHF